MHESVFRVCVFYVLGPKRSEVGVSCLQLWLFCASGRLDICSTSKCFLGSEGDPEEIPGQRAAQELMSANKEHTVRCIQSALVSACGAVFMHVLRDLAAVVTAPHISQKARGPREQLWFQEFLPHYTINKNLHGRNINHDCQEDFTKGSTEYGRFSCGRKTPPIQNLCVRFRKQKPALS